MLSKRPRSMPSQLSRCYSEMASLARERLGVSDVMSNVQDGKALSFQCFKCGSIFNHKLEMACERCGFDECPNCRSCFCSLDERERRVAEAIYYSLPAWLGA